MTRQADYKLRAVSLANLTAMCERESGMAHVYTCWVKGSRCILEYSNPDEYGHDRPYSVSLPLLRTNEPDNPDVLFHVLSERGPGLDSYDKEACFQTIESIIFSGPPLWRGLERSMAWRTQYEVLRAMDRLDEMPSAGLVRAGKDEDGTYRVVTKGGTVVAYGMRKADAVILERALWDAQRDFGAPDPRSMESV